MSINVQKVFFIGLGGAGQRHLRIYRTLLPNINFYGFRKTNKTPTLNPDFSLDRFNSLESKYNIDIVSNINEINNIRPDLTVISVPNAYHYFYSKIAFSANSNIFIEKPGCISPHEIRNLISFQKDTKLNFRVGYQRKYHPIFTLIKRYINLKTFGEIKKIDINVSSYIPDWHPYENYTSLYACNKDLGGGVLTTECHEINMIIDLFGLPLSSDLSLSTRSKDIKTVSDTVVGCIEYSNFQVYLDISFYRKPLKRELIFEFQKYKLFWDIDAQTLKINAKNENKNEIQFNLKNDELFILQAINVLKFEKTLTYNDLRHLEIYTYLLHNR